MFGETRHTPWPVIWGRHLRSSNAIARANALAATRVLQERRAEREEAERYLAERRMVIGPREQRLLVDSRQA